MDHDERLRWLETRITSSLHARSEDVKNLVSNEENRNVISEFFNKEGKRTMYIYTQTAVLPASLKASFQPPSDLEDKLILIQKCPETGKVSKDNISEEIFYCDCTKNPLDHLTMVSREVYLPMLCNEHFNATYGDDKVIDALQKCLSSFQITRGHVDGQIILPLPPIDILADATTYSNRSAAVIHLLESVMIGWIKQIKVALRFEPSHEIMKLSDHNRPGPLAEVEIWTDRYKRLNHIMEQLDQPLASDILNDLENANSTYWHSFLSVRKDILKALAETRSNLVYLNTMVPWFQKLHEAYESDAIASVFPPLIHLLYLVWSNSKYYHGVSQFHRLLSLIANEVVNRAQKLVGKRILEDTEESYLRLKDALRVCARFRGIYLDKKDKADSLNRSKMAALSDTMYGTGVEKQGAGGFAQILLTGGNGVNHTESVALTAELTDKNWSDSPWPARNNSAFVSLNSFMERCNDALELVQTSQHFRCLKSVVDVGGAGGSSLNALVEEIHIKFVVTMKDFLSVVTDVLDIDEGQNFENAFFHFRSVVRDLESRLASILGQTLTVCPTIGAKLRLLEVYEGISCRDNVRASLKSIINDLVQSIMDELLNVRSMFDYYNGNSPSHVNLPPVTGKLLWLYSIRARIQEPMSKMRQVSPDSLEDDFGWQVRHTYSDLINDISRCESEILNKWQKTIQADLRNKLKKHLLIFVTAEDGNGKILQVNLDPGLLLLLREIQYMSAPPLNINLPDNARTLLRSTDVYTIRQIADRLETIASKYNAIMKNMSYFERPLFQEKVDKIHLLLQSGLDNLTWKSVEAPDFIEAMTSLICSDVHRHLSIVQLNSQEINNVIASWSTSQRLDVFSIRSLDHSYSIEEVQLSHSSLREAYEGNVIPSGQRIHTLVKSSFENCQISRASPAWSDYINYLEDLVKRGLKEATMSSLRSMYNQLTAENAVPVLTIRLELIGEEVTFTPPLTKDTSIPSIQEISTSWLDSYLRRASLIKCLKDPDKTNGYRDDIENDLEIIVIVEKIKDTIEERIEEAKKCIAWYNEYSFLWTQDVQQSFQSFLRGKIQSMPESPTVSRPNSRYDKSVTHSATVSSYNESTGANLSMGDKIGRIEKSFLQSTFNNDNHIDNLPSLDAFDVEINIYKKARDEIKSLPKIRDEGWLRIDMHPIRQVLITYASKWMHTFTKYLKDQVTAMLNALDSFIRRVEPGIEDISGDEKDTAAFMKLMRIFNEVNAQQNEYDAKFTVMHKTVRLLEKYGQSLPNKTQKFFEAAPGRWNNLKTKVALAKQRLGPRIQALSTEVIQDLSVFGTRCETICNEFGSCEAFDYNCNSDKVDTVLNTFSHGLAILEREAYDLQELQELLEVRVVDFTILPKCRNDISCLQSVWETIKVIKVEHDEWKHMKWVDLDMDVVMSATDNQLDRVYALPPDCRNWDVYNSLRESILEIQAYIPIIEDLSSSSMRTRHWKQLIRVIGGNIPVDNNGLTNLSFNTLLKLNLQSHIEDVQSIVYRANKDLAIEKTLKTYEEVWLSKTFDLIPHTKLRPTTSSGPDVVSDGDNESDGGLQYQRNIPSRTSATTSISKGKHRNSISSLPNSLQNIQDTGQLYLLADCQPIFEEMESHQTSLQVIQNGTAASSFADEVTKWQKCLQTIEAVLRVWLDVQDKWIELEEIFTNSDVKFSLAHDCSLFLAVNRDFRLLMRATEKNPNVLQSCSRKGILVTLEKMNKVLEQNRRSLMQFIIKRRSKYPRFYFLSAEDVTHIICSGNNAKRINEYLYKLFPNIDCLVFEEAVSEGQFYSVITSIISSMGERLALDEPTVCTGSAETWLQLLTDLITKTLKIQLQNALQVSTERPSIGTDREQFNQNDNVDNSNIPKSWTIEQISEIALLATQVELTAMIEQSLHDIGQNNPNALQESLEAITASINAAIKMLHGSENDPFEMDEAVKSARFTRRLYRPPPDDGVHDAQTFNNMQYNYRRASQTMSYMSHPTRVHSTDYRLSIDENLDDGKILLLPSQIQKISNLILILCYQRDVVQNLITAVNKMERKHKAMNLFEWLMQMKYYWFDQDQECMIKSLDAKFEYGFEYQGSYTRCVVSPLTERCFVCLNQAIHYHLGGLCLGPAGCGKKETISQLTIMLGKPFYNFNCTYAINHNLMVDIFKGMAGTGAWICLNNIDNLDVHILSLASQLLSAIFYALKTREEFITIENETIHLVPTAACLSILVDNPKANYNKLSLRTGYFPSSTSSTAALPKCLLDLFRPVTLVNPDIKQITEVLLTTHGFNYAPQLTKQLLAFKNLTEDFLHMPAMIKDTATYEISKPLCTWNLYTIKSIIADAGIQLDNILSSLLQTKQSEAISISSRVSDEIESAKSINLIGTMTEDEQRKAEEEALVIAIRNNFVPRLVEKDGSLFAMILTDIFPAVDVPIIVDSKVPTTTRNLSTVLSTRSRSMPLVVQAEDLHDNVIRTTNQSLILDEISEAIAVSLSKKYLQPGPIFTSRVLQLAQLVSIHRYILLVGPSGCGKSKSIQTLSGAYSEMGRTVNLQPINVRSIARTAFFGQFDSITEAWKDGVFPLVLRKHMHSTDPNRSLQSKKAPMQWLQMDGEVDTVEIENLTSVFSSDATLVLANNERVKMPDSMRVFWEMEHLLHLSPATMASVGVLCMSEDDVTWELLIENWLLQRPAAIRGLLEQLCNKYIKSTLNYIKTGFDEAESLPQVPLKYVVPMKDANMIDTLCSLMEILTGDSVDLNAIAYEHYFNFSCIWAFGGTLIEIHRECFNRFWRNKWDIKLPPEGEVWDYYVSNDTDAFEFLSWYETVPQYVKPVNRGIPSDAFVPTVDTERLNFLIATLCDAGKSVLLVGEAGCGKTALVKERLRSDSGNMAEVLTLTVHCNKFTTSEVLWKQLDSCLEWKSGKIYVPKRNKSLLCLVDDLNTSKTDNIRSQSACELLRQHIDYGGICDPVTLDWRIINNVTYIVTYNPDAISTKPKLTPRLLRHFATIYYPHPKSEELHTIYSGLLYAHFLSNLQNSTQQSYAINDSQLNRQQETDQILRSILSSIVNVTIEVQNKMRTMFLRTSSRCHYLFTMRDLTLIFRNLCLSLGPGCPSRDLLLLWKHECYWIYAHRLVSEVDEERYNQAFITAARKEFSKEDQLNLALSPIPVFTNLVERDDVSIVTVATRLSSDQSGGSNSGNNNEESNWGDFYHPCNDIPGIRALLRHGLDEYNKNNPRIDLTFYDGVVTQVCRLVRILQSPHECGHALMVGAGCSGIASLVARLAAYLCTFIVYQINPSCMLMGGKYDVATFKDDLVEAYTNAGVKGEKIMLLLMESELLSNDFLVYISEYLVSGSITHLFTIEQYTSIINAIRTEVTQAGLHYSPDVAWQFFLQKIRRNLHVVIIIPSIGSRLRTICNEFPSLINNIAFMWYGHWSREKLVCNAMHHLKNIKQLTTKDQENLAHLMASMHLSIRHHDDSVYDGGTYGHITNYTFEKFVERFCDMTAKRFSDISKEKSKIEAALDKITTVSKLAAELKLQLDHELVVLEERKDGASKLLFQIGQDTAISEEQAKLVQKQHNKIQQLKKNLPEYQVAFEKAEFKARAIVTETKKLLNDVDTTSLSELRALQKPEPEVEDLLAAVIMIVKTPASDLTWSKGAKRLMANLDRFLGELSTFNESELPESTLALLEPYLRKPYFTPDHYDKIGLPAASSLCMWVRSVVRYHRMMHHKVLPLELKVKNTAAAVNLATDRLNSMESKVAVFTERLAGLGKGFEEASIDKIEQLQYTTSLSKQLEKAEYFLSVLHEQKINWEQDLSIIKACQENIVGGIITATASACYLGPLDPLFRQDMLMVHWPQCLKERGIPLVIDGIEYHEGYIVRWAIDKLNLQNELLPTIDRSKSYQESKNFIEISSDTDDNVNSVTIPHDLQIDPKNLPDRTSYTEFCRFLASLLVGDEKLRKWLTKGFGMNKLALGAIMASSWQRTPLFIDPHGQAETIIRDLESPNDLVVVDMGLANLMSLHHIEKAIIAGKSVLCTNIGETIDSMLMPLINHHRNIVTDQSGQRVVKFNNRYILCHKMFRLYLSTSLAKPNFSTEVASLVTLINYTTSREGLEEILIQRIFEHIQPTLNKEWRLTLSVGEQLIEFLHNLNEKLFARLINKEGVHIWDEISYIADAVVCKRKVTHNLYNAMQLSLQIRSIREDMHTLASQSASILTIIDLLSHLHHEYRYSLPQLLEVFDIALPQHEIDEKVIVTVSSSAQESSTEGEDNIKTYKYFKLPNIPTLPTPGVKYERLESSLMREFKTYLSQSVFDNISRGIYENHRIILATMLCLQLESDYTDIINSEHMQFLLYGAVLKDKPVTEKRKPDWLPDIKWASLIAFSELSPQARDIFEDFNEHHELWCKWYESSNPEIMPIGSDKIRNCRTDKTISSEQDFMRILLLRCLREDRVVNGFASYLREHINIKPTLNNVPPLHEIIGELNPYQPVLILMPAVDDITHMFKSSVTMASDSVVKRIKMTSKYLGIPCSVMPLNEEHEDEIAKLIYREQNWLIIEDIHMAKTSWLRNLTKILAKRQNAKDGNFRLFMTTQPSQSLPISLLRSCYKLAWDVVITDEKQNDDNINYELIDEDLRDSIIASLKSVVTMKSVANKQHPQVMYRLIYGMCLIHSLLISRQLFGTRAMNYWYPFTKVHLRMAIELALLEANDIESSLDEIARLIKEAVYGEYICDLTDRRYLRTLIYKILPATVTQDNYVVLGRVQFQLPPHNMHINEYLDWFKKEGNVGGTTHALSLDKFVLEEYDKARQLTFIDELDKIYKQFALSQNTIWKKEINLFGEDIDLEHIQQAIDLANEQLPTLLPIDNTTNTRPSSRYSDSMRSSSNVVSRATSARSSRNGNAVSVFDTVDYALHQECIEFNALLRDVKRSLNIIEKQLVGGKFSIPDSSIKVINSLQNGSVPDLWIHSNYIPTTHTLRSWLTDLTARHKQLLKLINEGIIQKSRQDVAVYAAERLRSIWIGGLFNPKALTTALMHEKAIQENLLFDDITIVCEVHNSNNLPAPELIPEGGLFLTNLWLEGARWNFETGLLDDAVSPLFKMPPIWITLERKSDKSNQDESTDMLYECPVYINQAHSSYLWSLPLRCTAPSSQWILAGVSMILDSGYFKYIMHKAARENRQ